MDILNFFSMEGLLKLLTGIIIVVATFLIDKLARRAITRYSKKIGLGLNVENVFKLFARIIIVASGISAILSIFGLPTEWFVSVSALSGAAIGFASTQTVGNFLAGLYIIISKPFEVGDYVKIGDVEGRVQEVTVNYTKVFTPTHNFMSLPNRHVLNNKILNCSKGDIVDYTMSIGFPAALPHNITNEELVERCLLPGIAKFYQDHKDLFIEEPKLLMTTLTRLERSFSIRASFPEQRTEDFYNARSELIKTLTTYWDEYLKAHSAQS